jgi:integrase
MSIVTRTDRQGRKRHLARIYLGRGKYVYGPTRDTKEEAKVDEARLVLEPRRRGVLTRIDGLCDWFLEVYPERPRPRTGEPPRASTVASAKHALRPFRQEFGHLRPDQIPREHVKRFAASWPWAVPTIKTMFADAFDSELVAHNPFERVSIKRPAPRDREVEFLTLEEVNDLADCALGVHEWYGPTFRGLLLWLAYTCMRPGEVFALEHADIDGDLIHVRRNLGRTGIVTTPKNHRMRRIILPNPARDAIREMPRRLGDLVFTTKRGRRYAEGTFAEYWRPVKAAFLKGIGDRRRSELDPPDHRLRPYDLRHFGATYLLDVLKVSAGDVAIQMGHEDGGLLVLKTYGHPSREAARERLRRAFNPLPVSSIDSGKREAENG